MKKILLFAATAAMFTACAPKTAPELPMETFFRNSEKSGYQISPDGKYFSYTAPYESRSNIFVQAIGSDEAIRITSETERDLAGYFWVNNNRILYLKDTGGDENFQLYGVNLDGSEPKAYTAIPGVRTQIIDPLEEIDSLMIIGTNQRNPMIFDPYRLNLNTGEMTMLCENPGDIQGWQTDHDGKLRVAYAIVDGVNSQIRYRDTEQEDFRPVLTTNFKESASFAGFTPDNKQVYAFTNLGRDKTALVLMDPATCEEIEQLYTNDKYDLSGFWYSDAQKKLLATSFTGHKGSTRHFFDKATEEMFTRMENHLKGYKIGIGGSNKAEDKFIVYAANDHTPGTYYFYDVKEDKMIKLAEVRPWIKEEQMADMTPVSYTSRDGLEIEGYLTLPVGKTMRNAKNLPVVINPHGGPWARDYWGYNPEVQFLANRGYAVLQMNFRGSTGFGRKFTEISYGKWGQTMQDDITDGVNWLIGQGIADPARIAIYGGSYGGYATLQGIVKTPDLYACAVDYVGVSNLFSFLQTIPPYWKPMLDMMYEMVGNPEKDAEMLRENSPALNADKIKTPLLVVQGANDPRVNINESNQMVDALRARGVHVDYMVKDNEGHGFHNEENRFEFYAAMEKFLGRYLKGIEPAGEIVPESSRR
ncbi:S9 family peptidase [uncultured Alistipes sp.]|uniref:S9 family peptidase n=1 Tax=uncultured Alistipes sp. TaxID=538949 RepID=UPI0025E4C746|nr:S9 family peptidase [uncultured Alistipes sp.]